jgi:uncharacterized protein (TIGR00369 family)
MKKVKNPFAGLEGYNCFGCSPDNKFGLQLHFVDDGDYLLAEWEPKPQFQGYVNVLHGGIQATLLDEIASWYVYAKLKTAGVTSKMEVRYKKPVYINKGILRLRAKLLQLRRNLADFEVELFDNDDQLCAVGKVQYFIFSEKVAKEKYYYPDYREFFEEE